MKLLLAFAAVASVGVGLNPTQMKDGETRRIFDGHDIVTIRRDGNDIDVKIDGAASSRSLTVTRRDSVHIDRDFDSYMAPRWRRRASTETWFICPNDHTIMRVPPDAEYRTYKCPVDGTTMERRKSLGVTLLSETPQLFR